MLGTPNDITWPGVSSNRDFVNGKEISMLFKQMIFGTDFKTSLRPRLHGIRSKWDRIHLDPIHFLRGVYTGSDPELFAFTRDRIHLEFMNS